jgi:hypothetical protein
VPLKKKPKKIEQLVGLMRDPDPVFVSIVDHGANQTPFAVVKRDKQGVNMIVNRRKGDAPTREQKGAAKNIAVRKLVFDTDLYPDAEAVTKYLTDNDWSGYAVTKKGAFYEAAAKDTKDTAFLSLREIDVVEGITAHVGELRASAQKAIKRPKASDDKDEDKDPPSPAIPTTEDEVDPDQESEDAADQSDEEKGTEDAPDLAPDQGKVPDADKSKDPHKNNPDRPDDATEAAGDDGDGDHREDPGNMGVNPVVPAPKEPQTPDKDMATDPVVPPVKPDHGPDEMRHDPEIPADAIKPIQVPLTDKSNPNFQEGNPTELACKFDQWYAMFSKDTDIASVVKEGMKDGLPPGIMEVTSAMITAMANTFLSADDGAAKKAQVAKIGAEYATMATGLYEVFEQLAKTDKKSVKAKGNDFVAGFKAFIADNADAKPPADVNANVRKGAGEADVIAAAISQALGGFTTQLQDSLKALSAKVDTASRQASEAVKLSKTASKTAEEVASAAPVKKGHNGDFYDLDPADLKTKSDDADEAFQRRTARNLFGL